MAPGNSSAEHQNSAWVSVAKLLRPQGRRGEILADPDTDQESIFSNGSIFRLAADESKVHDAAEIELQDSWRPQGRNAGRLVLKFAGVDSISSAEALEGKLLLISQAALPKLDEGTFFVRDLVGCTLFNRETPVGLVIDVQFPVGADGRTRLADAADLLVIQPRRSDKESSELQTDPDDESELVPFAKAWLFSVDLKEKAIHMDLPEGLLEKA